YYLSFFFSSRRRHTRFSRDWSSDVCSSDLGKGKGVALISISVIAILLAYTWFILTYAEYNNGFEQFYGGLARKWNPIVLMGDARSEERRVGKGCACRGVGGYRINK